MKNCRQESCAVPSQAPMTHKLSLLASALAAVGLLLPTLPASAAAPLPVPCGGCALSPISNTPFIQAGTLTNLDPNTNLPVANGTNLTINQSSQTAILNWQSFNIDHGYSVNFVQPSSTSSTLNKIWDAGPSNIAGTLTANGQIYLINHNGIIFGNGAQVNAGTLVASSLDISDSVYQAGYLANNDSAGKITPAFSGTGGFVRVDSGAVLDGSKIMMFAPVVENNGSIATSDGQAVLAAGNKVYLEASQDPNLRGVLVEVDVTNPGQAVPNAAGYVQNNAAGTVTNTGTGTNGVLAQRGNITLVGYAVNQQGLLSATTSVTENGSIKLLARDQVASGTSTTVNQSQSVAGNPYYYDIRATQTGNVTLGKNSVTEVLPETTDNSTTTDGQVFNPSIVEVMGKTVDVQGSIIAPGGKVNLVAVGSINPTVGAIGQSGIGIYQEIDPTLSNSSFLNPNYMPVATLDGARVFLDNGSLIDVSGSTASVSVARDILSVQLRGTELADAPLQKDGFLYGQTVSVDIRQGTPLANYSGEEAQIGRTVAERTSSGGKVVIASTGDVVMNPESTINISGGQVDYTGAYIDTTTLISNGVAYNIANASPNLIYDGTGGKVSVTHNKWGITQTWTTLAGGDARGTWDPGYVQGMAAGSVTVLAPNAALEGKILSNTVSGIYQRQPYVDPAKLAVDNYMNTWRMLPKGGTLTIGYNGSGVLNATTNQYNFLTNTDVAVQANPQQTNYALGDVLSPVAPITLDSGLFSSNLNNLNIYTNGIASITSGTSLAFAPGGAVTLQGGQVDMLGSIDTAGGSVSLKTVQTVKPAYNLAGAITVGANIETGGTWVNDSAIFGAPDTSKAVVKNGGNISINSGGDLTLASGLVLDATAGGWVDQSGKAHGGNGGNISLSGNSIDAPDGTALSSLGSITLRSYGVDTGKGGSFKLAVNNDIQVGGVATNGTLLLPAAFFQSGGFSSYTVNSGGANGLKVDGLIRPMVQSLILNRDATIMASGTDVYALASPGFLPDWQRSPVNITLGQTNLGGALAIDANAEIQVDPKASITLNAANQLNVQGTLDAPAGSINLNLNSTSNSYISTQSIWLGSASKLLANGYFLQSQPNARNLTQGQVLAGGNINISANAGYVVAQTGSVMDVSGTSANIDLPQPQSGTLVYRTSHIAGDAGSINVQAGEGALFDGSMYAGVEVGSPAEAGAFSLTLNNDPQLANPTPGNLGGYPMVPPQIQVMADGNGSFATQALIPGDDMSAGKVSLTAIAGKALLDASALQQSGFDQVKLKSDNSITLADQVNLHTRRSITLDTPQLVVNGSSTISSAHVTLGNSEPKLQLASGPVGGTGTLNVSGQLIDLTGNFTVSGESQMTIASSGDIRMNGVINSANTALAGSLLTQGNVALQADQMYPSTMAQFKFSVVDAAGNPAGIITILPGQHNPSPVMSAGGQLTVSAADIEQNGVLKAPLGTINLDGSQRVSLGAGSLTSVSANGQVVPFGLIQGGNTWMYDLTGAGKVVSVSAPPQKIVGLEGPNVVVAKDATVDLSGGGDLYANEYFAGTGGTVNVLDPAQAPSNTYAIIPGISGYSPYDPQLAGQYAQPGSGTVLNSDAMVCLAGGNGLKAGYYSLLPASYALLPGAYRVTAVTGYGDMQPGQVSALTDGTQIVAGKYAVAGTNIQSARWSGFAVSSGAIVRTQSEYHDSDANQFFATQATASSTQTPPLPVDAGQLIVSAIGTGATLKLDGTFNSQPGAGGNGSMVDLNGPGFDIVNTAGSGVAGLVELTTNALDNLGAQSLLIGGVRSQDSSGDTISVGASQVQVDNAGSVLSGPEIILAANNSVTVDANSSIQGTRIYSGHPGNITIGDTNISGNGALLRVSSGSQVTVTRNNVSGNAGTLTVANGAAVTSSDSVLLDASNATSIANTAILQGKAFSVAASNIDIGNGSSGTSSLSLTSALLTQMKDFQDITLHSYNDVNFYGDVALGGHAASGNYLISNLVLNAKSLNSINGNTDSIDAATVTLTNNNGAVSTAMPGGSGSLNVNADQIFLADGSSAIRGFDNVALNAAKQITGQGNGSLAISSGNLSSASNPHTLAIAGTITGTAKSKQSINASDYDVTINAGNATAAASADIGAAFAINGKSITDNGSITLPSGSIALHAADDVTLGATSQTVASGTAEAIAQQTAYAPAGSVTLTSDNGNVNIASGATVDVSGAAGGGDAGTLTVNAAQGTAAIAGNLKGYAAAGYAQGSFALDANALSGTLTALDNLLMPEGLNQSGGFNQSIDMRIRSGDLFLNGGSTVTANSYHLAADNGSIDVSGRIDASGTTGGDILLAAAENVTLESGAVLDAHATGTGKAGGKVALESNTSTVTPSSGAVNLMTGSYIDVSGATPGSLLLRASQINGGADVAVNTVAGTGINVDTGANVTVEGYKNYVASTISGTDVMTSSIYYTDAQAFANNAATIMTRLGMSGITMQVLPGVQISSAGDLTLASNWDLSTWRFNEGNGIIVPGILTLKAGGNLNIGSGTATASLSDGFTSATSPTLLSTNAPSWSYRLIAGADGTSANVMAVKDTGSSSVILAPGVYVPAVMGTRIVIVNGKRVVQTYEITPATTNFEMVRTGTGTIDIAAGGGLYLGNNDSMIYTSGRQMSLPSALATNSNNKAVFTTGGGDVNIAVKGDISAVGLNGTGSAVNQLVADWLWRQGSTDSSFTIPPAWWVNFGSFAQNIGVLGGGNLNISAGGNITSLSAVVPSTGYVASPGAAATLLTGGNLSVKAGGDIDSGIFYVGNGQGAIRAGGSLGTSRSDPGNNNLNLYTLLALGQGNIGVAAGGDINLQTVLNPTMIGTAPIFFTYGENSGVSLQSLNGNVLLSNDTRFYAAAPVNINLATSPYINPGIAKGGALTVYPGTLDVTALNGSISTGSSQMRLFPSPTGNLQLLAGSDINFNGLLTMSDVSLSAFQPNTPVSSYIDTTNDPMVGHGFATGTQLPLHSGDMAPVIIAAAGSIIGDNTVSPVLPLLSLPKSATIEAGVDIKNLSLSVQNVQSSDSTSMTAGRDIVFTPNAITPSASTVGITVSGPGQFVMQAGRNLDLGQSVGLLTNGNLLNPYLPEAGASITVLAGVDGTPTGTSAFIAKYIDPASGKGYAPDLAGYIANYLDPGTPMGQANLPNMLSYFFDPSTKSGQANTGVLNDFVASNGAPAGLTPAQAFDYLKTLPTAIRASFAYDFFNTQTAQVRAEFIASGPVQGGWPDLISFVNNHGGQVATADGAYTAFNKLPAALQSAFVQQVFFNELRQSGRSAIKSGNYSAGYDAIATLFPATNYLGDVNLYYSQIKTERGGDINILTPGGGVNAGLANSSSSGPQKTAAQLGIVTVDGGDVNAYVNNDFLVNQSRVFTLQGGNILMWSSYGNLDAGKGSKSVSSTPPPQLVVDPKTGTFVVDATQSVVGSGIRVLLANNNVVPGTVDLFAPTGVINAGDAGIGSAGNIFLGAQQVIGANNINFGGTGAGVPVATVAPVSVSGIGNMQDASKAADQATQGMSNPNEGLASFQPTFLSVEVIGLGSGGPGDDCSDLQHSHDKGCN